MEGNLEVFFAVLAVLLGVLVVVLFSMCFEKYKMRRMYKQRKADWEKVLPSLSDDIGYVDTFSLVFVGKDKKIVAELSDLHWQHNLDNCFLARYVPWKIELPKAGLRAFDGHAVMDKAYDFEVVYISSDNVVLHSPELGDMIIPRHELISAKWRREFENCPLGTKFSLSGGILFDE